MNLESQRHTGEGGFTLLELLISFGIFSLLFSVASAFFFDNYRRSHDHEIVLRTNIRAQKIADLLSYELRMLGAGVPFAQANFSITGSGVGDASLPLLTTSDASTLIHRFTEYGAAATLTADFDPGMGNAFNVDETIDLLEGDVVYVSNLTTGGSEALKGEISSVSSSSVSLDAGTVYSAGATFPAGSVVYRVSQITYSSPGGGAGILRSDGSNTLTMDPNATLSFEYLDAVGNPLLLPFTESDVEVSISAVRFTLSVTGFQALRSGDDYVKTIARTINLRNLMLIRA